MFFIHHTFKPCRPPIPVSLGCHNKVQKTGWLKATVIYCLTVLQSRSPSPESGCQQAHALSDVSKGEFPPYFFWFLAFPCNSCRSLADRGITPVTWLPSPCKSSYHLPSVVSASVSKFPLLIRTPVTLD